MKLTFTKKLTSVAAGMPNIRQQNGFWFIDDHLLVPDAGNTQETLYCIAYNCLRHFSTQKTYEALCPSFYWPNM